jgi:hypothetical protein
MTSPATSPPTWMMSVTESLALTFDTTAYLSGEQYPASAACTLIHLSTGQAVSPSADPAVEDTSITQLISGGTDLPAIGQYRLIVNFTALPSSNRWAMELVINAVA